MTSLNVTVEFIFLGTYLGVQRQVYGVLGSTLGLNHLRSSKNSCELESLKGFVCMFLSVPVLELFSSKVCHLKYNLFSVIFVIFLTISQVIKETETSAFATFSINHHYHLRIQHLFTSGGTEMEGQFEGHVC